MNNLFPNLFSPARIGRLEVKNRIAFAPMATHLADSRGMVTDKLIAWYLERARNNVGLIITESNYVSLEGRGGVDRFGLHEDSRLGDHRRLVDAVHKCGVPIVAQLHHGGRQVSPSAIGGYPVGPSSTSLFVGGQIPWVGIFCRELTADQIRDLVGKFGDAAKRAKSAGFDGVQVHAAHGYLIHSFLSPLTNLRTDHYGSDIRGRCRFLLEIIEDIRIKTGLDYPLLVRISGFDGVPGGIDLNHAREVAKLVERAGADLVDISAGTYDSLEWTIQPHHFPEGCLVHFAEGVKKAVKIPVGVAGRIRSPFMAEEILSGGKADIVNIGRSLIADPQWAVKAMEGRTEEIRRCIACNRCIDSIFLNKSIVCTVNPMAGNEAQFEFKKASRAKRVIIAGGGVGGMSAARAAAQKGHQIWLYEKGSRLGGQVPLAAEVPGCADLRDASGYLEQELDRLGVQVFLNSEVTPSLIYQLSPDALVIATGAAPAGLDIPGAELPNVTDIFSLLSGRTEPGQVVAVLGGGLNGACAAEYLAHKGRQVVMIKRSVAISGKGGFISRKIHARSLCSLGVEIITGCEVLRIVPEGVVIRQFGEIRTVKADTVVNARGMRPATDLLKQAHFKGMEIYQVGDCNEPREIFEAIHEGFAAGMQI